ncbi:quinol:cytochrome C oxidoreductase [Lacibacter luteus]|uniref:Quinol:cytochrome C oxidoreductase n=1 Tax=Lacibacter luteus TaxID=2508719 RepID=A0A4Q1CKB7_9BACT|nr:quinol:cytochrome C oxidoreductase [Lacibacter luteus]RXK60847.1 quinol:cytochrome C oxidoreductase [Lacibacter luteus]
MALKEQFEIPGGLKKWSYALMGVGVLTLILGVVFLHPFSAGHGEGHGAEAYGATKFWMALMHNGIFWLLVVAASFFFISATTLAQAGWPLVFRRVPEAISGGINVLGPIALVILLGYVWISKDHHIYHWKDVEHVKHDEKLLHKSGFLNPMFYTILSVTAVGLWMWFRHSFRKLSLAEDLAQKGERSHYWKSLAIAAAFLVTYGLTVLSTLPWMWLMSIDAHWYSTMYSWYTFASSWVAGISLIMLFVVYLKNQGYLEYVNEEHIHDIGKFMFAFSVFWTYLWFSQFMLIWYSNQPEETAYFVDRLGYGGKGEGIFRGIFLLNLIINFLAPLLILMRRGSKRNYTVVTLMAVIIIFGHWLDFYQMITPGPLKELGKESNSISHFVFSLGVGAGFLGLVIFLTAKHLTKAPLLPKNHPLVKESIIHHT